MKGTISIQVATYLEGPESKTLVFNPDHFVSASHEHHIRLSKHGFHTAVNVLGGVYWTREEPGEIQRRIHDYYEVYGWKRTT